MTLLPPTLRPQGRGGGDSWVNVVPGNFWVNAVPGDSWVKAVRGRKDEVVITKISAEFPFQLHCTQGRS